MRILILAGDLKNYYLYKKLIKLNYDVTLVGFDHFRTKQRKKKPAINSFDLIIGPIPFSLDSLTLYSPYADETFHIDKVLDKVNPRAKVVGGPFTFNDKRICDITKNKKYIDLNVLPICEELIKIIIDKTHITLIGSTITIYGHGSIAKRLYKQLEFLGAYVHIKSSCDDIEMLSSPLDSLDNIESSDVIINTLPGYKLGSSLLDSVKRDVLLIDVGSVDGGIDYKYAKRQNLNYVKARGLSGKSAPKTVSEYLFNTLKKEKII